MDTEIDWAAEAERLLADVEFYPDIIPVLSRDLVGPDVDYGCAGHLPDFHVPELQPNVAKIQGVAGYTSVNRSWGRLWPSCDAKNHLVTVRAPVSGARFPVHVGIAPLVVEGLRRQELGIGGPAYVLDPKQCGGFNCRPISGTNSPSNHSGGLAIDLDWTWNPFKKGAKYKIPEWVWRMWEWLGFYWGGRYHDYMHIEYLQSPEVARARIAELKGPVPVYPTLRLGDVNSSVEVLRSMLRLPAHNRFDQDTETAIKGFQTRNGLESDGVCGPMTWAALLTNVEDDDMSGAFAYNLPASAADDTGASAGFGHLEVIPVPPDTGAGAAQGANVWLQLYCGHDPVTIRQLGFRGGKWADIDPFTLVAGEAKSWDLPPGCTAVEVRYSSKFAFSALVEWRK